MHVDMAHAGKAYLCMGQLDEADRQYKRAMELEPDNAAFKAEAQLVDIVRNNLKQGRQCLEEGDARYAPPSLTSLCKGVQHTHTQTQQALVMFLTSLCHCKCGGSRDLLHCCYS